MSLSEFESILKELPTLKAPGVSGSRIKKLTDIAVKNVSEESQLVTILYSSCKATPSSHKLGTLYVVDSIVRVYMDEAKKQNQEISSQSPEGTFAAGVYKISELIESLVDDALELLVSQSQNTKISKLVDIWERALTFSPDLILSIRAKHFASTTPPGTPPRTAQELASAKSVEFAPPFQNDPSQLAAKPAANNDSGSILSALASLAKLSNSNSNTPTAAPAQPALNANNILSQLSALAGSTQNTQSPPPQPQNQFNGQMPMPGSIPPIPGQMPGMPGVPQGNEQYIFNMLQQMQKNPNMPQNPNMNMPQNLPQNPNMNMNQNMSQNNQYDRRGRDGPSSYSRRNRSRSPMRNGQPPQNAGFVPPADMNQELNMPGTAHYRPRNVGFDQTLPQGSFKVLSRTLFIGGVPRGMEEKQLASVLRPYAEVQSVILNSERKHAFVKVYSRREAEQVITSFNKDNSLPLRTRWGVGFGPRDCCNYQHGISIIPISRLTDADRSWVVSAQWGGTGGQPLSSGMVIDEPDIEIGAGISSKAMSKKMPTNSARNGPRSNRPGEPDEEYVKTTLIPQGNTVMTHGSSPEFSTYNQSAVNPLSGLFNNSNNSNNNGQAFPPKPPPFNGDPNLSAQLANFFQGQ